MNPPYALGQALTGRTTYDHEDVIDDLKKLCSTDRDVVVDFVQTVRTRILFEFRSAFARMVEREKKYAGENSYWLGRGGEL